MKENKHILRAGIITSSDRCSREPGKDASGPALAEILFKNGWDVEARLIVPDEIYAMTAALKDLADNKRLDLILTTGGTGIGPRDATPEATRPLLQKELPGFSEKIRQDGRTSSPFSDLSRGLAGTRGSTVIINLPGSPRGATESLNSVLPALKHALEMLAGGGHNEKHGSDR